MQLPPKRWPRSVLLPKYPRYCPIREVRNSRLATADELYHMMVYGDADEVMSIKPGSAIAQVVAIKLRGRGPSADYMAAILAREAGTKVAPGRDLSRIIEERQKYTQLSQEALLQKSIGCWSYVCICRWIRESAGPSPVALCRELMLPQIQMQTQQLMWPVTPYEWIDWRTFYEIEMRPD